MSDVMGKLGSYAGLLFTADMTDLVKAKFYGDVQEKLTAHLDRPEPRAAQRYRVSIKALARSLGGMMLSAITSARLMKFIASRRTDGVAGATIRRDLACLSSMFQFVKSMEWVTVNPVRDLDLRNVREALPSTRYLSKEEEAGLIAHAADHLKAPIAFAIETGLRLEEQLSLEWSQVNLERREVRLTRTQTSCPRVVPLTDRAMMILT